MRGRANVAGRDPSTPNFVLLQGFCPRPSRESLPLCFQSGCRRCKQQDEGGGVEKRVAAARALQLADAVPAPLFSGSPFILASCISLSSSSLVEGGAGEKLLLVRAQQQQQQQQRVGLAAARIFPRSLLGLTPAGASCQLSSGLIPGGSSFRCQGDAAVVDRPPQ